MIIRKPYAFLIKNFRKIHILLLLIGLFILYKTIDTANFVNEFMKFGTYDLYANPITNHISGWVNLSIFLMIVGSVSLLILLLYKKKPWKTYLIPIVTYILLFFVLSMIKSFFGTYTESVDVTDLRLSRDLLMIFLAGQLPALGVFIIRIFGLDVKKFDFNADLEFLDLSEEDREEIELSLNFDMNTIKRYWRKLKRNLGYFYQEHKILTRVLFVILLVVVLYRSYVFIFVTHKIYKQGDYYNASGYTFKVNNAYYTDKDSAGRVITDDSNFVIVHITVKNNEEPRNLNTSHFHLLAGNKNYETTETTYAKEFEDLGSCYRKVKKLQRDEEISFIIIYKVDKNVNKGKFVLSYQERGGNYKLRKIKLKIKDVSKINKTEKFKLGDSFDVPIIGKEDTLGIDGVEFLNTVTYKKNQCNSTGCYLDTVEYTAPDDYKIMQISFFSDTYEAKNMIDFLRKYGRINYKDSRGKTKGLDINFAVSKSYLGKMVYLKVPQDFETREDIQLEFVIRDKKYQYFLT